MKVILTETATRLYIISYSDDPVWLTILLNDRQISDLFIAPIKIYSLYFSISVFSDHMATGAKGMTCVISCINKNSSYWDTFWSRETKFSSRVSGKFQLSQFQLPRSFCTFSIKIGMSKIQFWTWDHLGLLKDWSCKLSLLYFSVSVSSEFPLYTEIKVCD